MIMSINTNWSATMSPFMTSPITISKCCPVSQFLVKNRVEADFSSSYRYTVKFRLKLRAYECAIENRLPEHSYVSNIRGEMTRIDEKIWDNKVTAKIVQRYVIRWLFLWSIYYVDIRYIRLDIGHLWTIKTERKNLISFCCNIFAISYNMLRCVCR